jgi:hypothetical protein
MVNINFNVIGVDDITIDSTTRFKCSTNNRESIFIGSDSTDSTAHIWQFKNGEWKRITDNLATQGFKSINSLVIKDEELFAATGRNYIDPGQGQVWSNGSKRWKNSGLSNVANANHLIRKLLKVGNDIYAAGSYYSLFKFDGTSWTEPINPSVASPAGNPLAPNFDLLNWVDIETDGSSVYGSVLSLTNTPTSGIIKYDGTSISVDAPSGFGSPYNLAATKLCYYDGYMHAATYNEVSGTEVWSQTDGGPWGKINNSGFGKKDNYMTVDMKVVSGYLVVSVANPSGGEVWAYDGSWTKQTINSDVLYDSYLIEPLNNSIYLIGRQKLYFVKTSDRNLLYTTQQRLEKALPFWIDGAIATVPLGNDRYRFIGPNAGRPVITEGTFDNPAEIVVNASSYFSSLALSSNVAFAYDPIIGGTPAAFIDILEKKPDTATGLLNTVFNLSNTSGICYFGGGITYKDPDTGIVLYPYYTEEGYWSPVLNWVIAMRLGVSFDNGLSFYDCGYILTPTVLPTPGGQFSSTVGPGPLGFFKKDDYFYILYGGDQSSSSAPKSPLGVARALCSEVIASAMNKQASPWKKYYNGSFSEPGIAGSSIAVGNNTFPLLPLANAAYLQEHDKIVLGHDNPVVFLDSNLYILTFLSKFQIYISDDGTQISYPQILLLRDYPNHYPMFVGDSMHIGQIKNNFFLYELSGVWGDGWFAQNVVKSNVSASYEFNLEKIRSFSIGRYLPTFKLNYTIDRGQLDPIYATMHDIVENRKLYEASSNYPVPNTSSTLAYQNYLRQSKWKNIYQSYANSATEVSGWGINSVENYYNFKFGNDLHKLYNIYTKQFNRHRLAEDLQYLDGANIFSHTYGPILYNHDLNYLGSSNLVISSLTSYDTTISKNNIFASANQSIGVYSSVAVFDSGYDLYNSSIVDGVDLVSISGSVNTNYFAIIKIPFSEKKKNSSDYMFNRTFIKMDSAGGSPYNQRLRFDISRKNLDSNLGYPLQNNFLLPEHEFKLNLKGIILNTNGTESGGQIGIWIHTQVEDGKYWSYDVNGNWVQHSVTGSNGVYFSDRSRYIHSLNTPQVNRQFTSGTASRFKCIDVITDGSNPVAPIYNLEEDDFYNLTLTFNTYNNYCALGKNKGIITDRSYGLSYGQVHRKNQKYFIEIFSFATNDRYLLLDEVSLIDLTMNEMAKTPAIFNICPQPKIELSKNQLYSLFTFWNDIAGKNHKVGYASRDSAETSGVMYSQGGSKLDYRLSTLWLDRSYMSGGTTLSSIEVPV